MTIDHSKGMLQQVRHVASFCGVGRQSRRLAASRVGVALSNKQPESIAPEPATKLRKLSPRDVVGARLPLASVSMLFERHCTI